MVDKISFKAIKNPGGAFFNNAEMRISTCRVVAQLTDEVSDAFPEFTFSNYKDIFQKYPDPLNKGFLRADCIVSEDLKGQHVAIAINGRTISQSEENIPVFEKIAKLTDKVHMERLFKLLYKKSPDSMPVEKPYLKSLDCLKNFGLDRYPNSSKETKILLSYFHNYKNVSNMFRVMNKSIQTIVENIIAK